MILIDATMCSRKSQESFAKEPYHIFRPTLFQKRPSNQMQNSIPSPPCTQFIGLLFGKGAQFHTDLSQKTPHNLVMEPLADRRCTFCFVDFPPPWFLKRRVGAKKRVSASLTYLALCGTILVCIYIHSEVPCQMKYINKVRSQSDEMQSRLFWVYTPHIALERAVLNDLRTIPHARYTRPPPTYISVQIYEYTTWYTYGNTGQRKKAHVPEIRRWITKWANCACFQGVHHLQDARNARASTGWRGGGGGGEGGGKKGYWNASSANSSRKGASCYIYIYIFINIYV